jgi:N,N'-diacetylchitobiose phosphorylase
MYRICVEGVLGLKRRGDELHIAPCVPSSWATWEAEYRTPGGGRLVISFDNPDGVCRGVRELVLDGRKLPSNRVPLPKGAGDHRVVVTLGETRAARVDAARGR